MVRGQLGEADTADDLHARMNPAGAGAVRGGLDVEPVFLQPPLRVILQVRALGAGQRGAFPGDLRVEPFAGIGLRATLGRDIACLCSISCCGFSHDNFSGLGRACQPRNGLNWMVLVSPQKGPERIMIRHAPSTVYPSFAAERGIRRVDRAENTCQPVITSRRSSVGRAVGEKAARVGDFDPYLPVIKNKSLAKEVRARTGAPSGIPRPGSGSG